ncbi:MAG: RsmB/NOP family class I SAM-dependent RNA methyltransferase [Bacteroidota bacterium]|nr:RsmB/NOP family class I SAM-dependent RNA methyltransferase [Bacteroidota bacterium]
MHFNEKLVLPIFYIVKEVLIEKKNADKSLQFYFQKKTTLLPEDKEFVAEVVYDLIRNWRLLQESFGQNNEYIFKHPFAFFPSYYYYKKIELPDTLKRVTFNKWEFNKRLTENLTQRKFRNSYPDALDAYCANDLGEEKWNSVSDALQQRPVRYIRINTLKTGKQELMNILQKKKIRVKEVSGSPTALEISSDAVVFSLPAFREGFFEIQDISSQLVSEFLAPEKGDKVIDACAGSGGKSLHLASLMQNKGKLVSMDVTEKKLEQLKKRAARANVQIIETRLIEGDRSIKRYTDFADKVLLDVPCSGTGVFKRNPDAKWKITPDNISNLIQIQKNILKEYSVMCKSGGMMVYANCSVLPSEGEKQIVEFLKNNPQWELIEEKRIHPDKQNVDGFYMAKLKRNK